MNDSGRQSYTAEYLTLAMLFCAGVIYYLFVSLFVPQTTARVLGASTEVSRYSTQYPIKVTNEYAVIEEETGKHVQIFYRGFQVDPSDSQLISQ